MRIHLLLSVMALASVGCSCRPASEKPAPTTATPSPAPEPAPAPAPGDGSGGDRAPAVPASHPQYQRVEGTSLQNGCQGDKQCMVGGCSNEICSAEEGAASTCEMPADGWPTAGASCGCVQGQCIWYKAGPGSSGSAGAGKQGEPCGEGGQCGQGLTCITYYGVAGTSGPTFTSCEIRCGAGGSCPSGQHCTTIADGPGEVCRPST